MQIRKPELNDRFNLKTKFYFVFCFLIVNKKNHWFQVSVSKLLED